MARGTFYRRYASVDEVYGEIVRDTVDALRTFSEQIACMRCGMQVDRPKFCEAGMADPDVRAVMQQPSFLRTMLGLDGIRAKRHFSELADRAGLTAVQARALYVFQVSGCHAVAASDLVGSEGWDDARDAVDCFIAGGFAALSARYGSADEAR